MGQFLDLQVPRTTGPPVDLGGTTPHTTPLGKKGGNEKALSQARGSGIAAELQESPSGTPRGRTARRIPSKGVRRRGKAALGDTLLPSNVPAPVQSSWCRTLTPGAPRNLTPVRFCLFYHHKESRLFSWRRQGLASEPGRGHAPGPPGQRWGQRLPSPGEMTAAPAPPGGPIQKVEGRGQDQSPVSEPPFSAKLPQGLEK